jgi:hypothetical protein
MAPWVEKGAESACVTVTNKVQSVISVTDDEKDREEALPDPADEQHGREHPVGL